MNRPPEEFVRVQEEALLTFATACFQKAGLSNEHAALISRLLVNSDLRGVRSHGSRTVNSYCQRFEEGRLNASPDLKVVQETPTTVIIDGDGTLDAVLYSVGENESPSIANADPVRLAGAIDSDAADKGAQTTKARKRQRRANDKSAQTTKAHTRLSYSVDPTA